MPINYFDDSDAARWYAGGRPYFHPVVMRRIRSFLDLDARLPEALDVACGTGQSAVALKEIAKHVTATDASPEMLAQAPEDPRVRYVEAPAEELLFGDDSCDMVTVALALHWLERGLFMREARRVLRPLGWLIAYDNAFTGRMKGDPEFERWYREEWLQHPSPARDRTPVTEDQALEYGFRLAGREEYTNEASFSVLKLSDYLMSQSNVLSAIRDGKENPETLRQRLTSSLRGRLRQPEENFEFSGFIIYLQRQS